MAERNKPQGKIGPLRNSPDGSEWMVIAFPKDKAEREVFVASLFVRAFSGYVAMQSEPSFAPFGSPKQNEENHIDFTVATAQGQKLMELMEFAPLKQHGPNFTNAPFALDPKEKSALAVQQVRAKSIHQGGRSRFLVIYVTEHAFWLDPLTVEHMRRMLAKEPPKFDRVYYVSIHDTESASVTEIFPGTPHYFFGKKTDDQLGRVKVTLPHPLEFRVENTFSFTSTVSVNGNPVRARVGYHLSGLQSVRHKF